MLLRIADLQFLLDISQERGSPTSQQGGDAQWSSSPCGRSMPGQAAQTHWEGSVRTGAAGAAGGAFSKGVIFVVGRLLAQGWMKIQCRMAHHGPLSEPVKTVQTHLRQCPKILFQSKI